MSILVLQSSFFFFFFFSFFFFFFFFFFLCVFIKQFISKIQVHSQTFTFSKQAFIEPLDDHCNHLDGEERAGCFA